MDPITPPAFGSARAADDSQQETGEATRANRGLGGGSGPLRATPPGYPKVLDARRDARCKSTRKRKTGG